MLPRGHGVMRERAPRRRRPAGRRRRPRAGTRPSELPTQPGDERFTTVTGRRTTIEWALATAAADEPGVEVRRGAAIAGLLTGPAVTDGVSRTSPACAWPTARRSPPTSSSTPPDGGRPPPDWIAEIGGRAPEEEAEDFGFTYTGRFFRSADGSVPDAPRRRAHAGRVDLPAVHPGRQRHVVDDRVLGVERRAAAAAARPGHVRAGRPGVRRVRRPGSTASRSATWCR